MEREQNSNVISAGVVVLRCLDGEWHFLLLRAYQYWDFPKGLVERNESEIEAAVREVEEETTLTDLNFRWGYQFFQTAPYGKLQKIAHYFIAESSHGEVSLPVSEELGHPEHEDYRWVTLDKANGLVSPRVKEVLSWADKVLSV